jgi:hypothetical protein
MILVPEFETRFITTSMTLEGRPTHMEERGLRRESVPQWRTFSKMCVARSASVSGARLTYPLTRSCGRHVPNWVPPSGEVVEGKERRRLAATIRCWRTEAPAMRRGVVLATRGRRGEDGCGCRIQTVKPRLYTYFAGRDGVNPISETRCGPECNM